MGGGLLQWKYDIKCESSTLHCFICTNVLGTNGRWNILCHGSSYGIMWWTISHLEIYMGHHHAKYIPYQTLASIWDWVINLANALQGKILRLK